MLTHFSLFSGIGGIDLAAEMDGFTTAGQCEIAEYPYKVLCKHWPDVPKWRDIRDVTAESIKKAGINRIDLLSGGFPCQPHSVAGKHKGSLDERDLWPEYRRVICEIRPKWVIGENVPGLLASDDRRFFRGILRDLAQMGYSIGWCVFGACDVGAPHKRDRLFVVAYSESELRNRNRDSWTGRTGLTDDSQNVADTEEQRFSECQGRSGGIKGFAGLECSGARGGRETATGTTQSGVGRDFARLSAGMDEPRWPAGLNGGNWPTPTVSDIFTDRLGSTQQKPGSKHSVTLPQAVHLWPAGLGQLQYDWEPPRVVTGIKNRTNRLKCLGNAVVPWQVYPILKAIHDIEVTT